MRLKTIIIEDEKPAARLLQRKLEKIKIKVDILLHSVEEAIEWFTENEHPDLIFLDIQLSDGLSFEIFDKVEIKSAIIYGMSLISVCQDLRINTKALKD